MARFARLRSASRALPATAGDAREANAREKAAAGLRARLSELAEMEAPAKELAKTLKVANAQLDERLDAMEKDLLVRFDTLPFVSLRAAIPRAVESHRREVVALLEVLLGARQDLLERLPQVEYLITMLSTEEVEGRRNIVNDPASITPMLEDFVVEDVDPKEADAIAMELYQAAALDSDAENFDEILRAVRAKKQKVGLGCLTQSVLRSVVTYNARMFNSVESQAEASRASDAALEEALLDVSEAQDLDALDGLDFEEKSEFLESAAVDPITALAKPKLPTAPTNETPTRRATDPADRAAEPGAAEPAQAKSVESEEAVEVASSDEPVVDAASVPETEDALEPISVFDSTGLDSVIEALRIRLDGGQVGRRGPGERVAVVLDKSALEPIEIEALKAISPDRDQSVLARTAIVGLMLRDVGPVRDAMNQLGIDERMLSDAWVRELNDELGRMVSEKLADSNGYELSTKYSGIKSKHLFKPFNALNAAKRGNQVERLFAGDESADEMRDVARSAVAKTSANRDRSRGGRGAGFSLSMGEGKTKVIAAAALATLAFGLGVSNMIGVSPTGIVDLDSGDLFDTSEYLQSAYRNEDGRGGLIIGRVDSLFEELEIEQKIEAANEMVANFDEQGVVEVMLYDAKGFMQVHYAEGELLRPARGRPANGSRPRRSGQASFAVRHSAWRDGERRRIRRRIGLLGRSLGGIWISRARRRRASLRCP